jgi:hypothetical protein
MEERKDKRLVEERESEKESKERNKTKLTQVFCVLILTIDFLSYEIEGQDLTLFPQFFLQIERIHTAIKCQTYVRCLDYGPTLISSVCVCSFCCPSFTST